MAAPSSGASDIDAFFAKRDARKKKATTAKSTTAGGAGAAAGAGAAGGAKSAAGGAAPKTSAPASRSSDWTEPAAPAPLAPPPVALSKQLVNLHSTSAESHGGSHGSNKAPTAAHSQDNSSTHVWHEDGATAAGTSSTSTSGSSNKKSGGGGGSGVSSRAFPSLHEAATALPGTTTHKVTMPRREPAFHASANKFGSLEVEDVPDSSDAQPEPTPHTPTPTTTVTTATTTTTSPASSTSSSSKGEGSATSTAAAATTTQQQRSGKKKSKAEEEVDALMEQLGLNDKKPSQAGGKKKKPAAKAGRR